MWLLDNTIYCHPNEDYKTVAAIYFSTNFTLAGESKWSFHGNRLSVLGLGTGGAYIALVKASVEVTASTLVVSNNVMAATSNCSSGLVCILSFDRVVSLLRSTGLFTNNQMHAVTLTDASLAFVIEFDEIIMRFSTWSMTMNVMTASSKGSGSETFVFHFYSAVSITSSSTWNIVSNNMSSACQGGTGSNAHGLVFKSTLSLINSQWQFCFNSTVASAASSATVMLFHSVASLTTGSTWVIRALSMKTTSATLGVFIFFIITYGTLVVDGTSKAVLMQCDATGTPPNIALVSGDLQVATSGHLGMISNRWYGTLTYTYNVQIVPKFTSITRLTWPDSWGPHANDRTQHLR